MAQNNRYLATLLGIFIVIETFSGCSTNLNDTPNNPPQPPPPQATPPPNDERVPVSPHVIYPSGWEEVIINANYAKTTVTVGAQF